jgi:ABC-type amino acid transport substrate-binding protein
MIIYNNIQLLIYLLLFLVGCNETEQEIIKIDTITKKNHNCNLEVGITPDQLPFAFMKDDHLLGFEIDLIQEIGKSLQCNIIFENLPFYSLIPSLQNRKIKLIIAGLSKTPEREKVVDFSEKYYTNSFGLLLPDNNFDKNMPIRKNMKIGVQAGTTMNQWLANSELPIELIAIDKIFELVEELKIGRIDAIVLDLVNAKFIAKQEENLFFTTLENIPQSDLAIATMKGDPLLDKVNKAITSLKRQGIIEQIKQKWGL